MTFSSLLPPAARALALCLALLWPVAATPQQQRPAQPASAEVVRNLEAAAADGSYNPEDAYQAMSKAGMSAAEINDATDRLRSAYDKAKAKGKDASKDQNKSGKGDWDWGPVYRDRDYQINYPLTNNCRMDQVVTIAYPGAFPLVGPATVTVPARSKIDVKMELKNSTLAPLPLPPWPPNVNLSCFDLSDKIKLTHPALTQVTKTAKGTWTYTCHAMEVEHNISMHMHLHEPGGPGGDGGGGGSKSNACKRLWDHGEFYPDKDNKKPEDCAEELRREAGDLIKQLSLEKAGRPAAWSWLPAPEDVNAMPVDKLLDMKARVHQTLTSGGGR